MRAKDVLKRYVDEILPEFVRIELTDVNQQGNFGNFPLKVAATRGDIEEIDALVVGGAIVNAKGEGGYTALHHAAAQGRRLAAVKRLLEAGASPHLVNDEGRTPRDVAKLLENIAIVSVFDNWHKST
jgi:ankyrin repeat protein